MAHHAIRRGLDIPLAGPASGDVVPLDLPDTVGFDPREFRGMIPRLAAREGDAVEAGQPLFFHKFDNRIAVVSPVAGTVKEVRRGRRRVITDYVVEVGEGGTRTHKTWTLDELKGADADTLKVQALAGGVWSLLRTRPLDYVADPEERFQAVLISGSETGPLMPGPGVLLSDDDRTALQAAVHVLGKFADEGVHVTALAGAEVPALQGLDGATLHTFAGPHPAGDAGVQVNHVAPPAGGRKVLWIDAWDAVVFGNLFLTGTYDPTRIYAAVGPAVASPRFVKTVVGAPVAHVVGDVSGESQRFVRGSVLTGRATDRDGWAPSLSRAVTVLSEDDPGREFIGWALPNLGQWSAHGAYLKGILGAGGQRFDLPPRLWGGHRAIVPFGPHKTVVATPDIMPTFLFKSMIAGDLEGSIELGMLDITAEEAALLSFICPSKIDYDVILRESLDQYAKEA